MKKQVFLFLACLLCTFFSLEAQKLSLGTFKPLALEKKVQIELDYTESTIDNCLYDDFVALEKNWDNGFTEICQKFVKEANKELLGQLVLSLSAESDYKLVLKVQKVLYNGRTFATLSLYNKSGEVIGFANKIIGRGGTFGSKINLMEDASEKMGESVGKFLKKQLK